MPSTSDIRREFLALFPVRGADIVALARVFLDGARGDRDLRLDSSAEARLRKGSWPGNVRQLQNEMQRAAVLVDGPTVRAEDISDEIG